MNPGLDLVGRQIGAYRVDSLIGAGGYSRVYRAIDANVGRHAAIKVLLPGDGGESYSESVIQRFEREARIVANLRDPHSVQLYEYGQTDDGMLYMIFEFIEGHTLEEMRRHEGALPALRVVKILEQILLSLEEAHAMGLVHRDIKPANIMLFEHIGRKDQVKVLDFGVGKSVNSEASHDITQTGMLIGTPRYMAPEQWSSDGEITAQTDIYSLGLVVYELLTGTRAITAAEPVHIMRAHIDDTPFLLPRELDIPSGLRRVVNTMMEKPRAARYGSARDVLEDLTRLKPLGTRSDTVEFEEPGAPRPALPATLGHRAEPVESTDTRQGYTTDQMSDPGRKRPAPALLAVLLLGVLAGALVIYLALSGDEKPAVPETASLPAVAAPEAIPVNAKQVEDSAATAAAEAPGVAPVADPAPEAPSDIDDAAMAAEAPAHLDEPAADELESGEALANTADPAEPAKEEVASKPVARDEKPAAKPTPRPKPSPSRTTRRKSSPRKPEKKKPKPSFELNLYPADLE